MVVGRFRGVCRSLWLPPGHLFNFVEPYQSRRKGQFVANEFHALVWRKVQRAVPNQPLLSPPVK